MSTSGPSVALYACNTAFLFPIASISASLSFMSSKSCWNLHRLIASSLDCPQRKNGLDYVNLQFSSGMAPHLLLLQSLQGFVSLLLEEAEQLVRVRLVERYARCHLDVGVLGNFLRGAKNRWRSERILDLDLSGEPAPEGGWANAEISVRGRMKRSDDQLGVEIVEPHDVPLLNFQDAFLRRVGGVSKKMVLSWECVV